MPPGIAYEVPESAGIGFPPLEGCVFSFCYVSFRKKNALWGVTSLSEVEIGSFPQVSGAGNRLRSPQVRLSKHMGAEHLSLFPLVTAK